MTISFGGTELMLLAEKAVFFPGTGSLVIGDVHIGKTTDLLREGIQVPIQIALSNTYRIGQLIESHGARQCFFLGDLFHSRKNPEFDLLTELVEAYPSVRFVLIRGNHEVLSDLEYTSLGLEVLMEDVLEGITLRHHPESASSVPMLAAHIHPKVRLRGRGRQTLSVPVFARQGLCLVTPAFGAMTGGHFIEADDYQEIFVAAEREVMRMK